MKHAASKSFLVITLAILAAGSASTWKWKHDLGSLGKVDVT
jgi:hypothetical protein